MTNKNYDKQKDIICIMNCLKKYRINPFVTISTTKSKKTILIIVVKDELLVLKKVNDIRNDILNINKKINLEWSIVNAKFIKIKFSYI